MDYKIECSPYTLSSSRTLNRFAKSSVEGYLLRFHFSNDLVGYSSLQSWPQLGDHSVKEEIEALQQKQPFNLGRHALAFAAKDAKARASKVKLYTHLTDIKNHFTLGMLEKVNIPEAFDTVKIKVNETSLAILKNENWLKQYKLRIDFNGLPISYQMAKNCLSDYNVDFFEDPEMQTHDGFCVFWDENKKDTFNHIIKPAKEEATNANRVIFTSYMDHPVNQIHAAIVANEYYQLYPNKKEICGLRTDLLFSDSTYLDYFNKNTNTLVLNDDGYGIGFTTLLERETWKFLG